MNDNFDSGMFDGRDALPKWRVLGDRIVTPILAILVTLFFSNQISEAAAPWLYSAIFGVEVLICLFCGFVLDSESVKYSMFSLAAYFFCAAVASLVILARK